MRNCRRGRPNALPLAPLIRRLRMAGEGKVAIGPPRLAAWLAVQHFDQIPVQAAVVFAKAVGERLDIELHMAAVMVAWRRERQTSSNLKSPHCRLSGPSARVSSLAGKVSGWREMAATRARC